VILIYAICDVRDKAKCRHFIAFGNKLIFIWVKLALGFTLEIMFNSIQGLFSLLKHW